MLDSVTQNPDGSWQVATAAPPMTVVPTIDVGTPQGPTPQPGQMGSQFRPVETGPKAQPGEHLPAQAVPPPAPSPATTAPQAPGPQAPAGWVLGPDGKYRDAGQGATPTAPAAPAAQPHPAAPPPPAAAPVPVQAPVPAPAPTPPPPVQTPAAAPPQAPAQPPTAPPGWVFDPNKGTYSSGDTAPPPAPATSPTQPPQPPQSPPARLPQQPPASHPATTASDTPWYQSVWDTIKAIDDGLPAAQNEMAHYLTMGYDEDVAAFPGAMILYYRAQAAGVPMTWDQAFTRVKGALQDDRHQLEQQHPYMSDVGAVTGTVTNALLSGNLYSGAKELLPRLGDIAMSGVQGGLNAFGLSEGDLQHRLDDARKGFQWGVAGGTVLPYVQRMIGGLWRSLRPSAQVDRKAGEALNEAAGGRQPTFDRPPLRNFPVGTGSATNDPGLAAVERKAATINDRGAVDIREGQQRALTQAATTPQPPRPMAPAASPQPQLASHLMTPSEASTRLQDAFRSAWQVFKTEERRLWSTPNLQSRPLNVSGLKTQVYNAGTRMPLRFQRAIRGTPGLQDTLDDFFRLPNHATLLDINDLRSDLLTIGRTATDPLGRQVANRMADELLRAVERDPNIVGNPAAWADYVAARNFTRQMWQTIGQKPFQSIIKPGSDPRSTGSSLFAFGPARTGERIPGGIADIGDVLDNIRRQWAALGAAGFDPAVAAAAQRELGQGAVDYIINSMIREIAASPTGAEVGQLNKLTQWIDRNRGWLVSGRLLQPEQLELLRAIRESAEMGARVGTLRGGRGSETAERMMAGNNPRAIDIFASPLAKLAAGGVGAGVGALFGHWGEIGLLAFLGASAEGLGAAGLERLYREPTKKLAERLVEAAQNPDIARDLMKRARDFTNLSEATQRWLRALGTDLGADAQHGTSPTKPLSQPAAAQ